jgi:hemolysin-activating ACP:hemolysin acyltransferase
MPGGHEPSEGTAANDPVAGPSSGAELTDGELRNRAALSKRMAAAFGDALTVLMRSPHYKHYSLADMEWLVLPAIATGQFSLADAQHKQIGISAPVALVLWASVSAEVDQRLGDTNQPIIRLKPQDWKSGDILWIVVAEGAPGVVAKLLETLRKTTFKGKPTKVAVIGADGTRQVRMLKPVSQIDSAQGQQT